jgi:hypothetical protein
MILWTIQTEEAWKQLRSSGCITGAIEHIECSWLSSYRWMTDRMKERIGDPPCKGALPIWAWYQWESARKKRPDLRSAGHLPKHEKGVRIEFYCHEDAALRSDFELWHYVLNYWYLPESIADGERFEAELESNGLSFFRQKPLPDERYHEKILRSWNKIFDLDWSAPDLASARDQKAIQCTIWQLNMNQVRSHRHFKSR